MNVDPDSELPISRCHDPLDLLLRARLLDPPTHPSLLACLDHYEILDWIGTGGMGIVFLARSNRKTSSNDEAADFMDLDPLEEDANMPNGDSASIGSGKEPNQGLVAIKLLRPELISNSEAVDRFLIEARHMQNLFHPNILQILEVCDRSKQSPLRPSSMPVFRSRRPFYVTPFVKHGNLAKRIQAMGYLPRGMVLLIARQIASALCYVHGKGIVHRDLKPGNILLGTNDHVYLADFGLARTFTNESLRNVRQSHCVGTSSYMSPALAAGEAEDTRSDIYSFGAILYEMLTGHSPYPETTPEETLQRILAGPPESIRKVNPSADDDLIRIAEGAMARKTRDRYSSMIDLLADLERIEHDERPHGPHGLIKTEIVHDHAKEGKRYRSAGIWIVIAALAACLATLVFWLETQHLSVVGRYELPGILHWEESKLVEWNGSPPKELMLAHQEELIILSDLGPLLRQAYFSDAFHFPITFDMCWDVDHDQKDELFIRWTDPAMLHLAVVNHHLKVLKNFQFEGIGDMKDSEWAGRGSMKAEVVQDLDRDGQRELLVTLQGNQNRSWRGLACYNFETPSLLWHYPTESNPTNAQLIDLDGDGQIEILAGSTASSNSKSDRILALSSQGQRLWGAFSDVTNEYMSPLILSRDTAQEHEIIVWCSPPREPFSKPVGSPRLYSLDYQGKLIATFNAEAPITGALNCQSGRLKQNLLIVTDASGYVYQMGKRLEVQHKRKLLDSSEAWLRVAACADLNADTMDEIIILLHSKSHPPSLAPVSVMLLNRKLDTIARCEVPASFQTTVSPAVLPVDWDGNRDMELLVLGSEVIVLQLSGNR